MQIFQRSDSFKKKVDDDRFGTGCRNLCKWLHSRRSIKNDCIQNQLIFAAIYEGVPIDSTPDKVKLLDPTPEDPCYQNFLKLTYKQQGAVLKLFVQEMTYFGNGPGSTRFGTLIKPSVQKKYLDNIQAHMKNVLDDNNPDWTWRDRWPFLKAVMNEVGQDNVTQSSLSNDTVYLDPKTAAVFSGPEVGTVYSFLEGGLDFIAEHGTTNLKKHHRYASTQAEELYLKVFYLTKLVLFLDSFAVSCTSDAVCHYGHAFLRIRQSC